MKSCSAGTHIATETRVYSSAVSPVPWKDWSPDWWIRTQLSVHVNMAPQQPSSRTDFLVRQRRHHLTFASYFQDRDILTSVIFQGCFVFPMVLLRQLGKKKHIPYSCKINTMRQDVVLVHFRCKAWEISVQTGRHGRVDKLRKALFCFSGCIVPLV